MKLGIFSNFSYNHVGGSETVLKNISEILVRDFNYIVNVYSFSCKKEFKENGVNYFPCGKNKKLIEQMNKNEHIFIYSDGFWELNTVLNNIDRIIPNISISLVGMYYLRSHKEQYELFKKNIKKFRIITHSEGEDYVQCMRDKLDVNVIPNGIDINEFKNNNIFFRKKYNIKEKYIILNVSNFFFGKNNYVLGKISKELRKKRDDFIFVQISSSIKYPYEQRFLDRAKKEFGNEKCLFLRNIPREDVVSAFKNSDIFISTSGKEVSPIIIPECRAAKLFFLSMEVGDVYFQTGGWTINDRRKDKKGYRIIDDSVIKKYVKNINELLDDEELRKRIINYGQKNIEKIDWKNIVPIYDKVFKKGVKK